MVEAMVRTLTSSPDTCIVLGAAHMTTTDFQPRVRRDGKRVNLSRYLHERVIGAIPDGLVLVPGGCKTPGCQNPYHRVPSRRRTLPKRKDRK